MQWDIVFHYIKGVNGNAESVYQILLDAALRHRYTRTGLGIVPVGPREITEAIFDLNNHDTVRITTVGPPREMSGQDLKELLITAIHFKGIEDGLANGTGVFFVLPPQAGSCDTAVITARPETVHALDARRLRLTRDHVPYYFQVKEYFNHERAQEDGFYIPTPLDLERLNEIAGNYDEETLIFLRDMYAFNSDETQGFFDTHPQCRLIGMPTGESISFVPTGSTTGEQTVLPLPDNHHNYMILYPQRSFRLTSLRLPGTIVREIPA